MIHLSKAAVGEIRRLQCKSQPLKPHFRLAVQPGGCAEMFYILAFDEVLKPEDQLYECDGIQVVVDPQSFNYISGLTLDYSEDLMGGAFRFHNPNAVQTCGCGNSFSLTQESTLPEDECQFLKV